MWRSASVCQSDLRGPIPRLRPPLQTELQPITLEGKAELLSSSFSGLYLAFESHFPLQLQEAGSAVLQQEMISK